MMDNLNKLSCQGVVDHGNLRPIPEVQMTQANPEERYFLSLINADRVRHGLDPVQLETHLNRAAESHSGWLLRTDSFSHTGSNGSSPGDRVQAADFDLGSSWRVTENLAYVSIDRDSSLQNEIQTLHRLLMNSPSHRANILDPDVTHVGIGLEVGSFAGSQVLMATQNFARTTGHLEVDVAPGITISSLDAPDLAVPPPSKAAWQAHVVTTHETAAGTAGHDDIQGSTAGDSLSGRGGKDWIAGGNGHDVLRGGYGRDVLLGQLGDDRLYGNAGPDRLSAGYGNDTLSGGFGNDLVTGERGRDHLMGQDGQDRLFGGLGDDRLEGGAGDDRLFGGAGGDVLAGGSGADQFIFKGAIGLDKITDFQPDLDRILIDKALIGSDLGRFVNSQMHETSAGVIIELSSGNRIAVLGSNLTVEDVADDIFLF
nr:CAP domain-containing protein [Paracoccus saliphilus]